MATSQKNNYVISDREWEEIIDSLHKLDTDAAYKTEASYSADATAYPDNLIPFFDKHINYIKQHKNVDPWQYLANLRLMTRIR